MKLHAIKYFEKGNLEEPETLNEELKYMNELAKSRSN